MKTLPETITVGNVCVRLCPMKGSHPRGMSDMLPFKCPWEAAVFRWVKAARHEIPEELRGFDLVFPDLRHAVHNPNGGDKVFARTLIWSRGDDDWIESATWEFDDMLVGGGLTIRFLHLDVALSNGTFRLSLIPHNHHHSWMVNHDRNPDHDHVATAGFEGLKAVRQELPTELQHCWLVEDAVGLVPHKLWEGQRWNARILRWNQDAWAEDNLLTAIGCGPSGKQKLAVNQVK